MSSDVAESPSTSNGEAKGSLPTSSSSSKLFSLLKSKRSSDEPPLPSTSPPNTSSSSSPSSTPPLTSASSPPSVDPLAKLAFWKKKPTSSSSTPSSSSPSSSTPPNPPTPKGTRSTSLTSPRPPSVLPNVSSMAMAAATGREGGGEGETSSPVKNGRGASPASPRAIRPASPPVQEEVAGLALSAAGGGEGGEGTSPTLPLPSLPTSATFPPPSSSTDTSPTPTPAATASSPTKPAVYKSSASYYSSLGGSSSLAAFRQSLTLGKSPSFSNPPPPDPAPVLPSDPSSLSASASPSPGVSVPGSPVTSPLATPRRIARQPSLDAVLTSLSPPPPPHHHHHSSSSTTTSTKDSKRLSNFVRLLQDDHLSLDALRKLSWQGVPVEVRSLVWKLLLEYVPSQKKRREAVLENRRLEYVGYLTAYDRACRQGSKTEEDMAVLRQIRADIPRTSPGVRFFQQADVQLSLERVLYVFAIRHPASGYVQGMNDLVTPFYAVFLRDWVADVDVGRAEQQPSAIGVEEDAMMALEADCYWCLSKLIDGIQDHYTFAQPGIQRQIFRMREVADRVDSALVKHLDAQQVQLLHFAFRWMNCLLMRELPLSLICRLWDSYLSEEAQAGFKTFHTYTCVALLVHYAKDIKGKDFGDLIVFLQKLPTDAWTDKEVETLLAQAFLYKSWFDQAPRHLQ